MNADQMVLEFRLSSDKLDSSTIPDLSNEEILYYLNVAQEQFVKTRYSQNNLYVKGFQEIQKRTDDLNNITKSYFIPSTLASENTYSLNLNQLFTDEALTISSTDEYMFYLRGNVRVSKPNCPIKYVGVNLVRIDSLDVALRDPFKKPTLTKPLAYFENGNLLIITNGFSVLNGKITCIKKPVTISNDSGYAPLNDCELAEHTHREIIELAVRNAIGDLEPQRLEAKIIQSKHIE